MTPTAASAEAGPSRPTRVAFTSSASAQSHGEPTNDDLIDIPSTGESILSSIAEWKLILPGLDFFHYRRALFLAAAPLPPNPSSRAELPSTYTVTRPPPALPPIRPAKHKNVERLEKLLKPPGAEESYEVWEKGIRGIWQSLDSGKHLKHGLRLGLVVSCFSHLA